MEKWELVQDLDTLDKVDPKSTSQIDEARRVGTKSRIIAAFTRLEEANHTLAEEHNKICEWNEKLQQALEPYRSHRIETIVINPKWAKEALEYLISDEGLMYGTYNMDEVIEKLLNAFKEYHAVEMRGKHDRDRVVELEAERDRLKAEANILEEWLNFSNRMFEQSIQKRKKAEAALERIVEPLRNAVKATYIGEVRYQLEQLVQLSQRLQPQWRDDLLKCVNAICDYLEKDCGHEVILHCMDRAKTCKFCGKLI